MRNFDGSLTQILVEAILRLAMPSRFILAREGARQRNFQNNQKPFDFLNARQNGSSATLTTDSDRFVIINS